MTRPSDKPSMPVTRNPLVTIGTIILLMLLIPAFLHSLAPDGPVKEGDAVFATGKHRVRLADPAALKSAGYTDSCFLVPRDRLVIVQIPSDQPQSLLQARMISRGRVELPFCPPQAEVLVRAQQVSLKTDLWPEIQETFSHLFGRD